MPEEHDRLIGEVALFIPGYECNSAVAPSDFDRLVSGYRLTQTALLRNPCCTPIVALVALVLRRNPKDRGYPTHKRPHHHRQTKNARL